MRKSFLKLASLSAVVSQLPAYAFIDWSWPNNMIPSNPKEIDRAMTAYNSGEVDTALTALNGIKGASQEDCRVRHILAELYKEQKRYSEARREYQELIAFETKYLSNNTSKPGWMDPTGLKLEVADLSIEEGNIGDALQTYREIAQQKPNMVEPKRMIGRCYELQNDPDAARQQYKSMLDSGMPLTASDKNMLLSQVAYLDKQLADKDPSNGHPQQQVATQPGGRPPQPGMPNIPIAGQPTGSSSFSVTGAPSGSHPVAVHAMGSGPLQDATDEITHKKYDEAITRLKPIVQKSPSNAQAHYLLAIAYVSKGQYQLARDEYEATMKFAQDLKLQKLASAGLMKIQNKN